MKRSLLFLVSLTFLSLLTASCGFRRSVVMVGPGPGPGPGPMVAYHYWYYPSWGVYYDYSARVYFYQEGPNWVRVAHLPPRFRGPGHYVVVDGDRDRPWTRYAEHRAQYPPGARVKPVPPPKKVFHEERREERREGRDRDHGPGREHKKHHFDDDDRP